MQPFDLTLETIARFMNCELSDHPVYDGLEVQVFDDAVHGRGMLAFLSRRADQRVDFYFQEGLSLDPATFHIGGGIDRWGPAEFESTKLEITDTGVVADVRFTDDDGRTVEVRIDDRDGRPRRRGRLLAPVGAGIVEPRSLMLVYMTGFDLVRTSGVARVSIDGQQVSTGRLPGQRLHRHRLIKVAEGLTVVHVNRAADGPRGNGHALEARQDRHTARLVVEPPLNDVEALPQGLHDGGWHVEIEGDRITGGSWSAERTGDRVDLAMEVTEHWRPRGLPLLMRLVTRIVPTFRQWPTTYRWSATVQLGQTQTMQSAWQKAGDLGDAYRRATGSS